MPKLPQYLSDIKYANPSDTNYTLFNYTLKTSMNMFEWLQTQPESLAIFNASMKAANVLKTKEALNTLSRILPPSISSDADRSHSEVLLVDIGGGKGDLLERLRKRRPDLKGRMILQDLPKVIEGRQSKDDVEYMFHDFFTPQPIKGEFLTYSKPEEHEHA